MEISVIVTVHNAEKYLRECLDSIVGQTFTDIEILCMDGGSMDSSPQILKEYAQKDGRLRIINDPNTSYGHKINEGIRSAKGTYISVLESDDMYREDMLEKLYTIMQEYGPDYVNADYMEFFDVGDQRYYIRKQMYRDEDYGYLQESGNHLKDMCQILRYWTGLFKREFLIREKIYMNESPGASFQDLSFRFLTSALAETSYHIKDTVYLYRSDNPDSSVYNPGKAIVTADEYAFLKGELKKRNIINPYIWQHFYVWKYNDLYANMIRFQDKARDILFQRSYEELESEWEVIERNNYRRYSRAIADFFDKSRQENAAEIDSRYQSVKRTNARRKAFYERIADCHLIIFGCGVWGKGLLKLLYHREEKILCYTDNDRSLWETEIEGIRVVSPDIAVEMYPDVLFVIANKLHADEIAVQLMKMGIQKEKIYKY